MNYGLIALWSGYFVIGFVIFISLIHLTMQREEQSSEL